MALTRTEKALSGAVVQTPTFYKHIETPGKPPPPVIAGATMSAGASTQAAATTYAIDSADADRFTEWLAERENGTLNSGDWTNLTPELQQAIATYEMYFSSPDYQAWAQTDLQSREMQYRLRAVDTVEAVNLQEPGNAPGVDEIIDSSGNEPIPGTQTEYVSTGGVSPELVYDIDGSIVTSYQSKQAAPSQIA